MHIPLKRHLLELHKRHLVELLAFGMEYGLDVSSSPDMPFPRSPQDVMATVVVCFEHANQVFHVAHSADDAILMESMLYNFGDRVAFLARLPWVELLREVDRAQIVFQQRLVGVDDVVLHAITTPLNTFWRNQIHSRLPNGNGLYTSLNQPLHGSNLTTAAHLVYWTTYQPALVRTCYVLGRGDSDLAMRMLTQATDRVQPFDELCRVKMSMHYALAHMYRLNKRYLEAINELRQVIQSDCGTIINKMLGR